MSLAVEMTRIQYIIAAVSAAAKGVISMEVMIPLITAVISGASAAAAAITVAAIQHRKTVAIIDYRLGQLEAKVEKHNKLVERTYELERRTDLQEEKIKVANHRIDDLEKKG